MTMSTDVLSVVTRADHVPGASQGCWTYEDYAALPNDGNRYEIIAGVLYMAAAPNLAHQATAVTITTQLTIHVQYVGLGVVFVAPTDVELVRGGDLVQPDVLVVLNANRAIIHPSRVIGAPDLVVEIASPSTATYDRTKKLDAYARAGVREYWLADPHTRIVELLLLEGEVYRSLGVFEAQALLPSRVIPGFPVPVDQLFPA